MKHLFLGLIASILLSLSGHAASLNCNSNFVQSKTLSNAVDEKSQVTEVFEKQNNSTFSPEKLCTIIVKMTIKVNNKEVVIETTQSFEASTFGCIAAKVAAFIVSTLEPSVTL